MPFEESKVKDAIKEHFINSGYELVLKEFDVGGAKADIAAFRWKDEYEMEAIAVECKRETTKYSLVEAAQTQARDYQIIFPKLYLATPEIRDDNAALKRCWNCSELVFYPLAKTDRLKKTLSQTLV